MNRAKYYFSGNNSEEDEIYDFEDTHNDISSSAEERISTVRAMNLHRPETPCNLPRIPSRTTVTRSLASSTRLSCLTGLPRLSTKSSHPNRFSSELKNASTTFYRPMSSISAAGYQPPCSSSKYFPRPPGTSITSSGEVVSLCPKETPKTRIAKMEDEIRKLCDESLDLGDKCAEKCMEKARAAETLEKTLVRLEEEEDLFSKHNWDITYEMVTTMAKAHVVCEEFDKALDEYQLLFVDRYKYRKPAIRSEIGDMYMKEHSYLKAIKSYRLALDKIGRAYPTQRRSLLSRSGKAFMKLKKFEEATACFESIMLECPDLDSAFYLCMSNSASEYVEAAKTSFLMLVDMPPYVGRFETWTTSNAGPISDELRGALEEVTKDDPLAEYYIAKKEHSNKCALTAARVIAPFLENSQLEGFNWVIKVLAGSKYSSMVPGIEVSKALCLLKDKEYTEAATILKKVADDKNEFSSIACSNLCFLLRLQNNIGEALSYGNLGVHGRNGDCYSAAVYVNIACCQIEQGEFAHAKELLKEAITLDPTSIPALFNLGLTNRHTKNYNKALLYFFKTLKVLPTYTDAYYQIALVLQLKKDYTRASEWFSRTLAFSPRDPLILFHLAELAEINGDLRQAYNYYLDTYKSDPTHLLAVKWLLKYAGHVLNHPQESEVYYRQGIELKKEDSYWTITLATAYKKAGNCTKSVDLLRNAHSEFPQNIEILRELVSMSRVLKEEDYFNYQTQLGKLIASAPATEESGDSSDSFSEVEATTSALLLSSVPDTQSDRIVTHLPMPSRYSLAVSTNTNNFACAPHEVVEDIEINELDKFFDNRNT